MDRVLIGGDWFGIVPGTESSGKPYYYYLIVPTIDRKIERDEVVFTDVQKDSLGNIKMIGTRLPDGIWNGLPEHYKEKGQSED